MGYARANREWNERVRVREKLGMMKMQVAQQTRELEELRAAPSAAQAPQEEEQIFAAEHTWEQAGSLGLKLQMRPRDRNEKSGIKVDSVAKPELESELGALVGLKIAMVNGEDVANVTYDQALAAIKAAGRPLTMRFIRAE